MKVICDRVRRQSVRAVRTEYRQTRSGVLKNDFSSLGLGAGRLPGWSDGRFMYFYLKLWKDERQCVAGFNFVFTETLSDLCSYPSFSWTESPFQTEKEFLCWYSKVGQLSLHTETLVQRECDRERDTAIEQKHSFQKRTLRTASWLPHSRPPFPIDSILILHGLWVCLCFFVFFFSLSLFFYE